MSHTANEPSDEEREDVLLSCRYGDLEDIEQFVAKYGANVLSEIRDENGNTALHMACGNGHEDVLDYLLQCLPSSVISAQNNANSTPLHWAAVNSHLGISQKLVKFPAGPGVDLIDVKNAAGHTPLGEAENAGWDEGAKWFVEVMNLGDAPQPEEEELKADLAQDVEVEIEDADGQIAKISLSQNDLNNSRQKS